MHYYQFNIKCFAMATRHLTLEEEGVYRRLLDFYYDTEQPIPIETQSVIRRLMLGSHSVTVGLILEEFFTLEDDGWHNYRADIEIKAYHSKAESARKNGKKGGRPPKNKGLETQLVNLANPEITGSKANKEQGTINNKQITSNKPKVASLVWDSRFTDEHKAEIKIVRKGKKITQRVINGFNREIELSLSAGYSFNQVVEFWLTKQWQAPNFEYLKNDQSIRPDNRRVIQAAQKNQSASQGDYQTGESNNTPDQLARMKSMFETVKT